MQQPYSNPGNYPPENEATKPEDTLSAQAKAKAEQLQQESRRLMDRAKEQVNKAKEQGSSMLAERKNAVADEIVGIAEAMRRTSQERQQASLITPYVERVADGLERLSNTLRERDLSSLLGQVESFARRQPGIFIGGAVATGFLLARFFRSSAAHREPDYPYSSTPRSGRDTGYDYSPAAGYESAYSGQAPDVIYAPPPSGATASEMPVEEAVDIASAGMTTTPFSEYPASSRRISDEDSSVTGPGTPATDRSARMMFDNPEVNLAAEAVDPSLAEDAGEPSIRSGTSAAGSVTTSSEANFTGLNSDKDKSKKESGASAAEVTKTS